MIWLAMLFAFEGLLVNLIMNPTDATEHNVLALAFLVINSLAVIAYLWFFGTSSKRLNRGLILSYCFRVFFLLWDVYARKIFVLPNSEGDALFYHSAAASYAFGSRMGQVKWGYYPYYVSWVYKFIGVQKVTVQFLNVFLAICSLMLVFKILEILEIDKKIAERVTLIVSILPNAMIITSIFLYESLISFLIILSLYFFVRFYKGGHWLNILPAVALSLIAGMTHIGGACVAIGFLIALPFIHGKEKRIRFSTITITAGSIMFVAVLAVLLKYGDVFLAKIGGTIDAEQIIYQAEELYSDGGSGYSIGIDGLGSVLGMIVNTPIRMLYFIGAPFPWDWRGLSDIIAFVLSAMFYITTVFFIVKAFASGAGIKNKGGIWGILFVLTISILVSIVVFGWGVSNSGSALRHREKFTYVFGVVLAVAYQITEDHKKKDSWEVLWK